LRHAPRVRSWNEDHLHLLAVLLTETCVFPRLVSLSFLAPHANFLHLLLSPLLRRCHLALSTIHSDLKSIGTHCTAMQDGYMTVANEYTTDESSPLSETTRSWKQLRYLRCPPLNSAAWMHLSNFPTLLKIDISGLHKSPLLQRSG